MNTLTNTPDDFLIRKATVEDCNLIMGLILELAEYEQLVHAVEATADTLRDNLFGTNPAAEIIIGEHQEQTVGYALFFRSFSTFTGRPGLYLEDIYIKPDLRGRGFGKQMMTHIARLALERKCSRLEWSVLDWNTHSIAFYQSIGAIPLADWTVQRLAGQALVKLAQ